MLFPNPYLCELIEHSLLGTLTCAKLSLLYLSKTDDNFYSLRLQTNMVIAIK